jgi:hypothetical protein
LVDDCAVGGDLKGCREANLSGEHVFNILLVGKRSGCDKAYRGVAIRASDLRVGKWGSN